jgi:hypothetical protein
MLTEDSYDGLVASVYRAAQGDGEWQSLLETLVEALDCWSGHLMGFEPATGTMMFDYDAGCPPAEATLDYIRRWHKFDSRNAICFKAPHDVWVHCHEHLSDQFVARDPFYQEFLIPYGSRYVSGMHFAV